MKTILKELMDAKVWKTGGSLVITIPKDIAGLFGVKEGSTFELMPISKDELTLRYKREKSLSD